MATVYISPTGSGSGDGSSWANAAKITQLSTMIGKAGAGGEVLLRADQGAYNLTGSIGISKGGAEGAPVTIRGVDGSGASMAAQIVGTRDVAAGIAGNEVFRLGAGASNLTFEDLQFNNVGNGAFRIAGDLSNLTIQSVKAYNVQRFIEDYASSGNSSASVNGLRVQDVEVHGYSKGVIRLQYNSHNIVIDNVFGDSERQSHDSFAMGVMLDGTVHDVLISRTTMANNYNSSGSYWNGDGFATEGGVYRVTFQDTVSVGNTDGGYDIKSRDTTLINAYASGNKRNFRIWSDSVTMQGAVGEDPYRYGGTGSVAQVWLADNAKLYISDSQFLDTPSNGAVFELSTGSRVLVSGTITYTGSGVYSRIETGASITTTSAASTDQAAQDLHLIDGAAASETVAGTESDDAIRGMDGDDSVLGGAGNDDVNGNVGRDTVDGGPGADMVRGGKDEDMVYGGDGDDPHVNGNMGSDQVFGGQGNDTVFGGQGADTVNGDAGDDLLSGDRGDDLLFGGAGADRFVLKAEGGTDWVGDFNPGEGDRIRLDAGAAYTVTASDGQAMVVLSTGDAIGLAGVPTAAFSADWIVYG